MQTTFPRLLLQHAAAAARGAGHAREGIRHLADPQLGRRWPRWCAHIACGLHQAGLQRGEHMVVVGANRPRLYAAMLAAQSLGAIPVPLYQDAVAAECVFPINNAEVRFAVAEDQEQVDKLLEIRDAVPAAARTSVYDDPRGLRNYDEPGLHALDALIAAGTAFAAAQPGLLRRRGGPGAARRRGRDVLHLRHHRQPQGRGAHPPHAARPRRGRRRVRQARPAREEVLAYLPPAWVGQNIFSYAQWLACGYVVNCPESRRAR